MTFNFISGETSTEDLTLEELSNQFRMIQSGERRIAIIGTRNLPIIQQQIIETLSFALAEARNTIITSGGASGVNSAAIKGALRASPELLEVVLPQTLAEQAQETKDSLQGIKLLIEHPERKEMDFAEASLICYKEIISSAHQLICFLYHDSKTLEKTIEYAKMIRKIVTVFYFD